jgi:hypothetical protein
MGAKDIWPENILIRMLVIVHTMHQATNEKTVKDRSLYEDAAAQLNEDCKYDHELVSATTREYTRKQVQDKYENLLEELLLDNACSSNRHLTMRRKAS